MRSLACMLFVALCTGCGGSSESDGTAGSSGASGAGASGGSSGNGGSGGGVGGSSGTGGSSGNGGVGGSGGQPGEWTTLIDGGWEVPSGDERYWCVTKTLTEDVYVNAFRAIAPEGTHHTLLLYGGGGPDGEFACGPTLDDSMLFASGVGTNDLSFPKGVALKIPAGTQILLNLHLFNTSPSQITGVSGTEVQTIPAAEVQQEAEMILPGAMSISIPPNGTQTVTGDCTFPAPSTISTLWPHMHQYGVHMKVVHEKAGGDSVLHDAPFSFYEQVSYPLNPPVLVGGGESIRVECSYKNTTSQTVHWGDSSEAEMCFVALYRYPKLSQSCD